MKQTPFPEVLDRIVFDAALRVYGTMLHVLPEDAQLASMVRASFEALTPEQRAQIVSELGPEWYLKLATKIEKELAKIDKVR
jgi:hypothetical protein